LGNQMKKSYKKKLVFFLFWVGSGSVFPRNESEGPDPDPYQNETDP